MCFTSTVVTTFVYAATSKEGGDLWGDILPEGTWTTNEMQRSVLAASITMRDDFLAEHCCGITALHCTAMAEILIPAECSAP